MMEIEKKFAQADLSSLKEAPVKLFAKAVVQYQNFKTSSAFEKFSYKATGWSEKTAKAMFDAGVSYVKYGSVTSLLFPGLRKAIDEIVESNRYTPLTPAWNETRKCCPRKNKGTKPIIAEKDLKPLPLVKSLIQSFIYAIRIDNMFMTFNSESEAKAFAKGYKFANPTATISEVHIDKSAIEEVK